MNNYVEIDIWDIGRDTTRIDNFRDRFVRNFHNYRYSDEDIAIKITTIDTLSIQDPDENLLRKRVRMNFIYSDKLIT